MSSKQIATEFSATYYFLYGNILDMATAQCNPYVFIMDLDGTIIGDCTYQSILYNIENILKGNQISAKADQQLLESYRSDSKLVRPYFKYFINTIKTHFPNSLFYIYTASEKSWAEKEIKLIEKANDLKISRPLFTRDDCITDSFGNYRKSVKKILPRIIRANKKCKIENEKILVIDNNNVFIDFHNNFLLCPTYNHILYCSVWEKIKKEYLKVTDISNLMTNLITTNKIFKIPHYIIKPSNGKLLEQHHKWLYKKHKKLNSLNKKYSNDMFWKLLATIIVDKKFTTFDKENVAYLQSFFPQ